MSTVPPTDAELAELRARRDRIGAEIEVIDRNIARLQAERSRLVAEDTEALKVYHRALGRFNRQQNRARRGNMRGQA